MMYSFAVLPAHDLDGLIEFDSVVDSADVH